MVFILVWLFQELQYPRDWYHEIGIMVQWSLVATNALDLMWSFHEIWTVKWDYGDPLAEPLRVAIGLLVHPILSCYQTTRFFKNILDLTPSSRHLEGENWLEHAVFWVVLKQFLDQLCETNNFYPRWCLLLGGKPTHLKNIIVKLDHHPQGKVKNKNMFETTNY